MEATATRATVDVEPVILATRQSLRLLDDGSLYLDTFGLVDCRDGTPPEWEDIDDEHLGCMVDLASWSVPAALRDQFRELESRHEEEHPSPSEARGYYEDWKDARDERRYQDWSDSR